MLDGAQRRVCDIGLGYLLSLGEIVHVTTITDAMPEADEMDPESCYLGFEIDLRSAATRQEGNEAAIFRALFPHSIALVSLVGLLVMLYAYVFPGVVPGAPR